MSLGFKANVDGSAAIQSNGVDQITISPSGQVAFPNTTPSAVGVGQNWQDMSASRTSGTTYTNSTGRTLMVDVTVTLAAAGSFSAQINGVEICRFYQGVAGNSVRLNLTVPNGATYRFAALSTTVSAIVDWQELR